MEVNCSGTTTLAVTPIDEIDTLSWTSANQIVRELSMRQRLVFSLLQPLGTTNMMYAAKAFPLSQVSVAGL
jgi:hypothetical protein